MHSPQTPYFFCWRCYNFRTKRDSSSKLLVRIQLTKLFSCGEFGGYAMFCSRVIALSAKTIRSLGRVTAASFFYESNFFYFSYTMSLKILIFGKFLLTIFGVNLGNGCQHFILYPLWRHKFDTKDRPVFYRPNFKLKYLENEKSFFKNAKSGFYNFWIFYINLNCILTWESL